MKTRAKLYPCEMDTCDRRVERRVSVGGSLICFRCAAGFGIFERPRPEPVATKED